MEDKRLTIVMPCYNKAEYIEEAIQSVLQQKTDFPFWLIIADDCSTDESLQIAKKYGEKYPDRILVMESEKNRGLLANDLRVFAKMKTDYFCVLDPDDYYTDETFLQDAVTFLERNPEYVCYGANVRKVQDGQEMGIYGNDSVEEYTTRGVEAYLMGAAIVPCTISSVYRNAIFKHGIPPIMEQAVGTLSESSFRGDHDRFVIHLKYGKGFFKRRTVGVYRLTDKGICSGATQFHNDLLEAKAKLDYSRYYEEKYHDGFMAYAKKYCNSAVELLKQREEGKISFSVSEQDERLYEDVCEHILADIEKEEVGEEYMEQKQMEQLYAVLAENSRTQKELYWAQIFEDTIRGSEWLSGETSFSPGRWAVGYPGLYLLYRVLNDCKPESILELGLGQSTKLTAGYADYYNRQGGKVEHCVVEHDGEWIDFFRRGYPLPEDRIVKLDMVTAAMETENGGSTAVNLYAGFAAAFENRKFDLIFVDAPPGSDEYSRLDILDILPECLMEDFVIIVDDTNRIGESRTVQMIQNSLAESGIQTAVGIYSGEKATTVITTPALKFICTM